MTSRALPGFLYALWAGRWKARCSRPYLTGGRLGLHPAAISVVLASRELFDFTGTLQTLTVRC